LIFILAQIFGVHVPFNAESVDSPAAINIVICKKVNKPVWEFQLELIKSTEISRIVNHIKHGRDATVLI